MRPHWLHWLGAALVALGLHGGVLATFLMTVDTGAKQAGVGGVQASLGMAGGAPGAKAVTSPEVQAAETEDADAVAVSSVPTVTAKTLPPDETSALGAVSALEIPVTETAEEPPVEVFDVAPTMVPAEPANPQSDVPATASPIMPQMTESNETDAVTGPKARPDSAAAIAGSTGRSGTQTLDQLGAANHATQGGRPGAKADYLARLAAWLERHKEYPRSARRRREQGTATLVFTVGRTGQVTGVQITKSSGSATLDREVRAMIQRALPLPRFSNDMTSHHITLAVPIRFSLR